MTAAEILATIGLAINLAGSVTIAYAVRENPGGANQMVKGKKVYLAAIYLVSFRVGIALLFFGFLLQIITFLL